MQQPSAPHPVSPTAITLAAPPVVTSVSPKSGPTAGGTTVTVSGANFTGASAVRFGTTPAPSFTVNSPTQITAVTPPGTGTVQVTVTTPSGTSTQFVTFAYVAAPAPVLASLFPPSGPAPGGTGVTLNGTNLTNASAVRFGTTPAPSFTVNSPTQITAVTPPGTGTVQVTVTTPGGTSNGLPYTFVPLPALTGVSPDKGPTYGGNTVTLTGTDLSGATAVLFGATAATSFTVNSATQITAVAPPGNAGPVEVTVTTSGGTTNPGVPYFYTDSPVLGSLVPDQGPLAGGNTVTLYGVNLLNPLAVSFGATPATAVDTVSGGQLTAVAPAGTGTVQVTVTTPGGTSNGLAYTYLPVPTLTGVSPAQGPAQGGNVVTLTGTGLGSAGAVLFGGTPAAFSVVSNTMVTATVPPGAAGPVNVTVTTPGGTSGPVTYNRTTAPGI